MNTRTTAPLQVLVFLMFTMACLPFAAAEKSDDASGGDSLLGVWRYQAEYQQKPMNFLRITRVGSGKLKLEEGFMDDYSYKDQIFWLSPEIDNSEPIYLAPSRGAWKGSLKSPNFRPTHGRVFTYKLTLTPKTNDKVLYTVWCSIRGGESETFEATRAGLR